MKINGITFGGPKPVPCVIPVGNDEVVFMITPVMDFEEFEKLCPRPEPPGAIDNKGNKTTNPDHPSHIEAIGKYADQRMEWMYLKAVEGTEGLEWENVNMEDPSTYTNFTKELVNAGIPIGYIDALKMKIIQVCGLDPDRIEEATKRFLASQELAQSE